MLKITAPFLIGAGWQWITWETSDHGGNLHAAMISKGGELSATAWDYGQARYELNGNTCRGRP